MASTDDSQKYAATGKAAAVQAILTTEGLCTTSGSGGSGGSGSSFGVILEASPFYAESGGQVRLPPSLSPSLLHTHTHTNQSPPLKHTHRWATLAH